MLAIAAGALLLTRLVGERIVDPRNLFGANLSDLGQHLFVLLGCYQLAATAIETAWEDQFVKQWRLAAILFAAGLIITYWLSDAWTTPSDEFQLSDGWSLAHDWLNLTSILVAFSILLIVSLRAIIVGPRRLSMITMYALATIVIGCIGTVAIMMIANPAWVHTHYHSWAIKWTTAGLWVLFVSGIPTLWEAWVGNQDPH